MLRLWIMCVILSCFCMSASAQISSEGPSGGRGGERCGPSVAHFSTLNYRLRELRVRAGGSIDSMDFAYFQPGAPELQLIHCGGTGGNPQRELILDPDEFIVQVFGSYANVIDFLRVTTNKGKVRAWGNAGNIQTTFVFEAPPGLAIVGFNVRSATLIDAIGVVVGKP